MHAIRVDPAAHRALGVTAAAVDTTAYSALAMLVPRRRIDFAAHRALRVLTVARHESANSARVWTQVRCASLALAHAAPVASNVHHF